jgi:ferritin-like metal-binding protein YciE
MKLDSMEDLYLNELEDLYDAEHQILQALPKMIEAASAPELKSAFQLHEQQTRGQVQRLEQVFQQVGQSPKRKKCPGMAGIIAEGEELVKQPADPEVRDAGLIVGAQKVEHYEMAGYGSARTFAQMMGQSEAAQLLQQTLDEEGETDKKLTALAQRGINRQARAA